MTRNSNSMTRHPNSKPTKSTRSRTAAALAVIVGLLAVGLPAATTGANLTSNKAATSATTTAGDWCAVPGASQYKNVYSLNDATTFDSFALSATSTTHIAVIPVANDGSFQPVEPIAGNVVAGPPATGAVADQLGVRLWGCGQTSMNGLNVKATAWRGNYPNGEGLNWKSGKAPVLGSFASARLNPAANATGVGPELRDLHRGATGATRGNPNPTTMRYSWLLDEARTKNGARAAADPVCVVPSRGDVEECTVARGNGVVGTEAFSMDDSLGSLNAISGNSVTYLGEKYYAPGGTWPTTTKQQAQCDVLEFPWWGWKTVDVDGTSCPRDTLVTRYQNFRITPVTTPSAAPLATPTTLPTVAAGDPQRVLRDTTGNAVQYVVLEWWGTLPPQNLAVEVFVK